jgi:membrane associated rhomboid family serine protease
MRQLHVPPLTKTNKTILIVLAGAFLLQSILGLTTGIQLTPILGLSSEGVLQGRVYQLFTYVLVQRNFFDFLFNALIFWFIGADLELRWGRKIFLTFLLTSVLGAALFYLGLSFAFFRDDMIFTFPMIGISGMSYALLLAYGMIFSDRILTFMLIFPMKAKYFCGILAGIELYMAIFSPYAKSAWGHLGAMISGVIYLKLTSQVARGQGVGNWIKKYKKENLKRKLTLIKNESEEDKDPKYWQ